MMTYITVGLVLVAALLGLALWARRPYVDRYSGHQYHHNNNVLWFLLGMDVMSLLLSILTAHVQIH